MTEDERSLLLELASLKAQSLEDDKYTVTAKIVRDLIHRVMKAERDAAREAS